LEDTLDLSFDRLQMMMTINDLPTLLNRDIKILLNTDDTSITVNSPNPYNHQIIMEEIFL